MKQLLILCSVLLLANPMLAQEKMEFNVRFSELYATYDFIRKVSDYYPDNAFKQAFLSSKYNTAVYQEKATQLDTLYLDYRYYFEQYTPTLKSSLDSRSTLEKNLIQSNSIEAFKKRSFGTIPSQELTILSDILTLFLPVYNELIFEPNRKNFEAQLETINMELRQNKVPEIFNDVLQFYGTNWDNDIPFEVIASPTIGRSGIGARAFLNIAVIRFPLNFKSYDILYSVMLHEIFHIGYDNQPIALKNSLKTWFNNTNSENSAYAFQLMNEVLATALGNGYAYEELRGKLDAQDWYYVKYVNLMAKELYPTIRLYLEQGKTIDEAFIKTYVGLYDSKFPQWTNELDNILTYRTILCTSRDDSRYFRRNYFPTIHKTISPINESGIEEMKQWPISKVVVISENHQATLELLKAHFDILKSNAFEPNKEFIQVFQLADRTKLILINKHQSSVETLMNTSFENRMINHLNELSQE